MTWNGCTLTRMWKESLPEVLVTYLLAQIRAASSASEESCSYSSETKWQQKGNSSTEARFLPRSKIRIYKKVRGVRLQKKDVHIPWDRGHHGYTLTWGMACSCSSGSSERDDDPFLSLRKASQQTCTKPHPSHSISIHPSKSQSSSSSTFTVHRNGVGARVLTISGLMLACRFDGGLLYSTEHDDKPCCRKMSKCLVVFAPRGVRSTDRGRQIHL